MENQSIEPVRFSTQVKSLLNSGLNRVGLHLDSLTAYRQESRRLQDLREEGYFDEPAFPVPSSFRAASPRRVLDALSQYGARFDDLSSPERNPVGFSYDNGFFSSPDAEVLYCMIRLYQPGRIVEVGSGNSTRISRLAVMDGGFETTLVSIDPQPRSDIDELADQVYRGSVETLGKTSLFAGLKENDLLFIDSSHELRAGNDLTYLYLRILPLLAPGVIVHVHDVFLPYDYRADWVLAHRLAYAEQYLIQAMLQYGEKFEVLWPGYFFQKTLVDFSVNFPHMEGRDAQSLWLRTT